MPVPALSFASRYYNCNAGIMVTASHNPAKYNGYKAYTKCYTDFSLRDYYYLGSGYAAFGGEITYSFARLFKGRGSVFAAASGDYVRADDHRDLFGRRFYANFKIGLLF